MFASQRFRNAVCAYSVLQVMVLYSFIHNLHRLISLSLTVWVTGCNCVLKVQFLKDPDMFQPRQHLHILSFSMWTHFLRRGSQPKHDKWEYIKIQFWIWIPEELLKPQRKNSDFKWPALISFIRDKTSELCSLCYKCSLFLQWIRHAFSSLRTYFLVSAFPFWH